MAEGGDCWSVAEYERTGCLAGGVEAGCYLLESGDCWSECVGTGCCWPEAEYGDYWSGETVEGESVVHLTSSELWTDWIGWVDSATDWLLTVWVGAVMTGCHQVIDLAGSGFR